MVFSVPSASKPGIVPTQLSPRPANPLELHPIQLPFYDVIEEIQSLKPLSASGTSTFPINLNASVVRKIANDNGHLVQLRLFEYTGASLLEDRIPDDCQISVNSLQVTMPPLLHNYYPNMPKRHLASAIDITARVRIISYGHALSLEIKCEPLDNRQWLVGLWLVRRLDVSALFERLINDYSKVWPKRETLSQIAGDDGGEDAELMCLDPQTVSLLCPFTHQRIGTPALTVGCRHLERFDLRNLLAMRGIYPDRPSWLCPICKNDAHYSKLRIDQYFQELLADVPASTNRVILDIDGSWKDADLKPQSMKSQQIVVEKQEEPIEPMICELIEPEQHEEPTEPSTLEPIAAEQQEELFELLMAEATAPEQGDQTNCNEEVMEKEATPAPAAERVVQRVVTPKKLRAKIKKFLDGCSNYYILPTAADKF